MDAITALPIKTERNPLTGSSDDFRNVADGFAALVQITGNKTSLDGAKSAAEGELMRLDDSRDLVRDSHTLNDTETDNTEGDDATNGEDGDDDTRKADDAENSDSDEDTSETSDSETSEDADGQGEGQDATGAEGNGEGQPQVAGDGAGADLSVIEGAAAAAAATTQAKTTVETVVTDTAVDKTVKVATGAETGTAQSGLQSQQQAEGGVQQITATQSAKAETAATPTETQTAQTATAATQAQATTNQTTATQANPAQTQQGQQVVQERAQNQSTESRSAAAQAQSQDLSKRLGDSTRAQVQVNVTGQQASQASSEASPFNRFVGYNSADSRTVSTANGQAGTGNATNAAINNANTPAEKPAVQTAAPIPASTQQPHTQASQPGTPSGLPRAELSGTPARSDSGLGQTGTGQTNSGASSAPQPAPQASAVQNGQSFAQATQQTASAERPPAPSSSQVIQQIKVNINKSLKGGLDRVTIQLRPENLGKVEVKMELSQDGKVRAFVTAESKETLDLLQRDARGLEKALQDAGLRTDSNNLHFALKSDSQDPNAKNNKDGNGEAANDNADEEGDELLIEEEEYDRALVAASRGGVDQLV